MGASSVRPEDTFGRYYYMYMKEEQISFVYPTLIKEGMSVAGIYPPDLSLHLSDRNASYVIAVTAGILMKPIGLYFMEVEINFAEKPVPTEQDLSGSIETKFFERTKEGQQLAIYTMFSNNISLDREGFYRVTARIYSGVDKARSGDLLDEKDCFFYVSHRNQ